MLNVHATKIAVEEEPVAEEDTAGDVPTTSDDGDGDGDDSKEES